MAKRAEITNTQSAILEIVLQIAIDLLERAGLSDQFESAIRDGIGLEALNEYLIP